MKRTIIFSVFILLPIFFFILSCSADKNVPLEQKLQNVLDKGLEKYNVKASSAAVIFPDGKLWTVTSGISHDTHSVKKDMVFAIGSITKNFVAALTLKLVEEGKLSLDDPLSKWLPAYPHVNSEITIRQLLNHSSGIYMFWSNQKIWDDLIKNRSKIWKPEEVLSYIKEPYFEPGEGFRYSNTNYLLLAMIITRATESTLSSELRKHFWQPLNIKSTRLSIEEEIPDNQIHVFGDNFNDDDSYIDMTFLPRESHDSITYGSAGIFMNAEDLALWCHSLFNGEILNQQSMDEMLHLVSFRPSGNMRGYGLGVQLFRKRYSNGKKALGHSGANIGTSAYMIHLPDNNLSVVIMINSMNYRCLRYIFTNLINVSLKEINAYSIIPGFEFFPYGIIIIVAILSWTVSIVILIRHRSKRKNDRNNMMQQ